MKYLGLDTSNYATSAAVYDSENNTITGSVKIPLEVKKGSLGLRQSDAVFLHNKNLPAAFEELAKQTDITQVDAVGVSAVPRNVKDSYMPCFLAGTAAAEAISYTKGIPLYSFSHQAGHIMAALYGTGFAKAKQKDFAAFHISGGTTDMLSCTLDGTKLDIETVMSSLDLFAGQAVDRVGGMLGFAFPAGEQLSRLANGSDTNDSAKPTLKENGCCLSGLENKCRELIGKGNEPAYVARYCLNSIAAAVSAMIKHYEQQYGAERDIICAGGVMASVVIRQNLTAMHKNIHFCEPAWLSADNAAGTAILAARARNGHG